MRVGAYLEVIGTSRQKLVTDMQCLGTFNAAKITLAYANTPRFIADVDKDIVPA